MDSPLRNFLKQLNLLDAVFIKENGEVYNGFISEVQKKIDNVIKPDAYYVFNKQPLILFFDLTNEKNRDREKEIHKQVWSFDSSPVIFVIKGNEIRIYNALNYSKEKESLEEIELTEEERISKFSFWELQSGFTWKWLQNEYFENRSRKQQRKRVNERLFQNIKDVRTYLTNSDSESYLHEDEANSLILRLIFIRYLIDRKVKIDETFIAGDVKNVNERRRRFINLIKQPLQLNSLFKKLNAKFNGVLFKKLDIVLTQKQSNDLADIFKGELQDADNLFQGFFFEIFDFSIIPVEVISGIYESLIDTEKRKLDSAVYTPPFLVEYILNDTLDKYLEEKNTAECKIFEVAVGSGIFLVQSLRKMIDKELKINPNQNKKTFSKRIREIAKNNLFGIDTNEEALKVACFSIYIALLDYQKPKDIDVYKFPELLNENLFEADFFNTKHIFNELIKQEKPKFILGNPPWKKDKSKKHLDWVNTTNTYSKKITGKLEIAQSFLLRTKDFMDTETKTILIVTSTLFYNVSSTTKEFKKDFLISFCIEKFFDLSPVRRLIFEKKNSPASIVFFNLSKEDNYKNNVINHQSVKSNYFLKHFKMLVIEKYDQKKIFQKHFLENDWMFKVALYGNTLDYNLLKRINKSSKNNIEDCIDGVSIFGGAGFHKGTEEKYKPFKEILNKKIIENGEVQKYYSVSHDNDNIITDTDVFIKSGREEGLYKGKQILIKEQAKNESEIVVSLTNQEYIIRSGIFSIASIKNKLLIEKIYSFMISYLYEYFIFMTSGSWGTSTRPQIRWKEEYLSFPIIKTTQKTEAQLISLINELIKPYQDFYNTFNIGEPQENGLALIKINNIINKLYAIKNYEKDLIDYVLNVSRYQFQESKQHLVSDFNYTDKTHYRNRDFVLKEYASVYIKEFQKIYTDEYIQVEVYPLDHFIALNFVFSAEKPKKNIIYPKDKKNEKEVLKRLANNLSISQITNTTDPTKNLFIQKDIKGFEDNSFYIIKPNEYKCWHKAMAWYDVAEFKEAIQEAEIDEINMDA